MHLFHVELAFILLFVLQRYTVESFPHDALNKIGILGSRPRLAVPSLFRRQQSAEFPYMGCYADLAGSGGARSLSNNEGNGQMTVELCETYCRRLPNCRYFGLQYYHECWFGETLGEGTNKVDESECNTSCDGNRSQTCGGSWRLSLYGRDAAPTTTSSTTTLITTATTTTASSTSASASVGPTAQAKAGDYGYQGCYYDAMTPRALDQQYSDWNMTPDMCARLCNGSKYMGLEYGFECYCGEVVRAGSNRIADADCSSACMGDSSKLCGNSNRLTFYIFGGDSIKQSDEYDYLGCYRDQPRTLTYRLGDSKMTTDMCARWAKFNGYKTFGLEYGVECWAGEALGATAEEAQGCDINCAGDGRDICGGHNKQNVYRFKPTATEASSISSESEATSDTSAATTTDTTETTSDVATFTNSDANTSSDSRDSSDAAGTITSDVTSETSSDAISETTASDASSTIAGDGDTDSDATSTYTAAKSTSAATEEGIVDSNTTTTDATTSEESGSASEDSTSRTGDATDLDSTSTAKEESTSDSPISTTTDITISGSEINTSTEENTSHTTTITTADATIINEAASTADNDTDTTDNTTDMNGDAESTSSLAGEVTSDTPTAITSDNEDASGDATSTSSDTNNSSSATAQANDGSSEGGGGGEDGDEGSDDPSNTSISTELDNGSGDPTESIFATSAPNTAEAPATTQTAIEDPESMSSPTEGLSQDASGNDKSGPTQPTTVESDIDEGNAGIRATTVTSSQSEGVASTQTSTETLAETKADTDSGDQKSEVTMEVSLLPGEAESTSGDTTATSSSETPRNDSSTPFQTRIGTEPEEQEPVFTTDPSEETESVFSGTTEETASETSSVGDTGPAETKAGGGSEELESMGSGIQTSDLTTSLPEETGTESGGENAEISSVTSDENSGTRPSEVDNSDLETSTLPEETGNELGDANTGISPMSSGQGSDDIASETTLSLVTEAAATGVVTSTLPVDTDTKSEEGTGLSSATSDDNERVFSSDTAAVVGSDDTITLSPETGIVSSGSNGEFSAVTISEDTISLPSKTGTQIDTEAGLNSDSETMGTLKGPEGEASTNIPVETVTGPDSEPPQITKPETAISVSVDLLTEIMTTKTELDTSTGSGLLSSILATDTGSESGIDDVQTPVSSEDQKNNAEFSETLLSAEDGPAETTVLGGSDLPTETTTTTENRSVETDDPESSDIFEVDFSSSDPIIQTATISKDGSIETKTPHGSTTAEQSNTGPGSRSTEDLAGTGDAILPSSTEEQQSPTGSAAERTTEEANPENGSTVIETTGSYTTEAVAVTSQSTLTGTGNSWDPEDEDINTDQTSIPSTSEEVSSTGIGAVSEDNEKATTEHDAAVNPSTESGATQITTSDESLPTETDTTSSSSKTSSTNIDGGSSPSNPDIDPGNTSRNSSTAIDTQEGDISPSGGAEGSATNQATASETSCTTAVVAKTFIETDTSGPKENVTRSGLTATKGSPKFGDPTKHAQATVPVGGEIAITDAITSTEVEGARTQTKGSDMAASLDIGGALKPVKTASSTHRASTRGFTPPEQASTTGDLRDTSPRPSSKTDVSKSSDSATASRTRGSFGPAETKSLTGTGTEQPTLPKQTTSINGQQNANFEVYTADTSRENTDVAAISRTTRGSKLGRTVLSTRKTGIEGPASSTQKTTSHDPPNANSQISTETDKQGFHTATKTGGATSINIASTQVTGTTQPDNAAVSGDTTYPRNTKEDEGTRGRAIATTEPGGTARPEVTTVAEGNIVTEQTGSIKERTTVEGNAISGTTSKAGASVTSQNGAVQPFSTVGREASGSIAPTNSSITDEEPFKTTILLGDFETLKLPPNWQTTATGDANISGPPVATVSRSITSSTRTIRRHLRSTLERPSSTRSPTALMSTLVKQDNVGTRSRTTTYGSNDITSASRDQVVTALPDANARTALDDRYSTEAFTGSHRNSRNTRTRRSSTTAREHLTKSAPDTVTIRSHRSATALETHWRTVTTRSTSIEVTKNQQGTTAITSRATDTRQGTVTTVDDGYGTGREDSIGPGEEGVPTDNGASDDKVPSGDGKEIVGNDGISSGNDGNGRNNNGSKNNKGENNNNGGNSDNGSNNGGNNNDNTGISPENPTDGGTDPGENDGNTPSTPSDATTPDGHGGNSGNPEGSKTLMPEDPPPAAGDRLNGNSDSLGNNGPGISGDGGSSDPGSPSNNPQGPQDPDLNPLRGSSDALPNQEDTKGPGNSPDGFEGSDNGDVPVNGGSSNGDDSSSGNDWGQVTRNVPSKVGSPAGDQDPDTGAGNSPSGSNTVPGQTFLAVDLHYVSASTSHDLPPDSSSSIAGLSATVSLEPPHITHFTDVTDYFSANEGAQESQVAQNNNDDARNINGTGSAGGLVSSRLENSDPSFGEIQDTPVTYPYTGSGSREVLTPPASIGFTQVTIVYTKVVIIKRNPVFVFRPPYNGYAELDFPDKAWGNFAPNSTLIVSFDLEVRPYSNFTHYASGTIKWQKPCCEFKILVGCVPLFNETVWDTHGTFNFTKTDLFLAPKCMPITFLETCHHQPAQLTLKNLYVGPPDEDEALQEYFTTVTNTTATVLTTATLKRPTRETVSIYRRCLQCY